MRQNKNRLDEKAALKQQPRKAQSPFRRTGPKINHFGHFGNPANKCHGAFIASRFSPVALRPTLSAWFAFVADSRSQFVSEIPSKIKVFLKIKNGAGSAIRPSKIYSKDNFKFKLLKAG